MSLCTQTPTATPLSYCGSGAYGAPGILYIGDVGATIFGAQVVLENLATGRRTIHINNDTEPLVEIDLPLDLSPGQVYRVWVVVDGMPVAFRPYVLEVSTSTYIIGTQEVDAVHVMFNKIFDGADVYSPTLQWLSLS
jgi:hypothetical protein